MAGLVIAPKARIFHGHDWVYGTEVRTVFGNPKPGDVVLLKDQRDHYLGSAMYNPQSQIIARRFSRRKQDLDRDFFARRIAQAITLRERLLPGEAMRRVVWSESDGLPGLIVDQYADVLVVQTLTMAMYLRLGLIRDILCDLFRPRSIIVRNDSPMLAAEGIEPATYVAVGEEPAPFVGTARGIRFCVDLATGQKTGLYLDQMQNYADVAKLAAGRRVLDCFSNQGGFGLACALAGAAHVTSVDISEEAIAAVRRNAELNGVSIEAIAENAFDFLKRESDAVRNGADPKWDLIILDPPSFTRNKKSLAGALRGYKEIHLRALQMLPVGGILSTFCCSHHASDALFRETIANAAVDGHCTLRLLRRHGQSPDHPVLLNIPETEYLKGYTYELVPGR